jgi:hypothetical protein
LAPVAIVEQKNEGDAWQVLHDLRPKFVPLSHYTQALTDVSDLSHQLRLLREQLATLQSRRNLLYEEMPSPILDQLRHETNFEETGAAVALDAANPQQVVPTTTDNAQLLYGVVMAAVQKYQGGIVYLVVTYGRTRCKVVGDVAIGDLLIPAIAAADDPSLHGCAMRAGVYVRPGTLIGKALQSHRSTNDRIPGVIDIMVTLG